MSMDTKPIEVADVSRAVTQSANIVAFLNTALCSICAEGRIGSLTGDGLMGMQSIMFTVEETLRGVEACLEENPPRPIMLNQTGKAALAPKAP